MLIPPKSNILDLILNERYEECDTGGHKKPNIETSYCNYCYRHIKEEGLQDYPIGLRKLTEELTIKLQIMG